MELQSEKQSHIGQLFCSQIHQLTLAEEIVLFHLMMSQVANPQCPIVPRFQGRHPNFIPDEAAGEDNDEDGSHIGVDQNVCKDLTVQLRVIIARQKPAAQFDHRQMAVVPTA